MKKTGGEYESPKTMKDEVKFMKKGGAPKSLVKHEMNEHAKMKKMANGGPVMPMAAGNPPMPSRANAGGAVRGQARAAQVRGMNGMPAQAKVPAFANGGKVKMGAAKGTPFKKANGGMVKKGRKGC